MINGSARDFPSTALGPRHAAPARRRLSNARAAVLRALIASGSAVTVAALAEELGQHPNTVREHLDALAAAGRTERLRSQPVGRGRPAWLYRAVGPADAPGTGDGIGGDGAGGEEYAALALALIDEVSHRNPDPRPLARHAGERWGATLAARRVEAAEQRKESGRPDPVDPSRPAGRDDPCGTVIDMLEELRFEPQRGPEPGAVRLTTCPLLDAARRSPDVVCEVHRGIVRGALQRLGGDPDGVDLVPFAEPGACLLTLPVCR